MKILRTIGILVLVAGLVLGGAGSAFAQEPPDKRHGFFGTADSVLGYVVTLVTKQGWTVDVTLTDTAKYMVPRKTKGPVDRDGFEISLDGVVDGDITAIVGKRIAVVATNVVVGGYKEFTADAIRLMLVPSSPLHFHRVGVVDTFVAGAGGKIIITDRDGVKHEFKVSKDTVYRPADKDVTAIVKGKYVTVVTKGDPKKKNLEAKAIVLHEKKAD